MSSSLSRLMEAASPKGSSAPLPGLMDPRLLEKLPALLAFLPRAGSAIIGFVFSVFFFLVFVGPRSFRDTIAPVAGFHLIALFLWREVHEMVVKGIKRAMKVKRDEQLKKQLSTDIRMSFTTPLD